MNPVDSRQSSPPNATTKGPLYIDSVFRKQGRGETLKTKVTGSIRPDATNESCMTVDPKKDGNQELVTLPSQLFTLSSQLIEFKGFACQLP
jgi:hypothetical protein